MLRLLSVIAFSLFLVIGLAACGGGEEENGGNEEGGGGGSVDVAAAEKSFEQNCASCHGQNLEGRGNAPSLEAVGKEMSQDEILQKIQNGGGGMPGGLIKGEEAENVAAWLETME
ncbi:c-type cytochrome [Pseudalkalibacillus salsuginis]|uniref:c-type cytochrome n=1 Tax=Pseudalkalibacillus salsuginis TaxID=2910972 RepID=UPI001CD3CADE|nr:cytochrome c [Pseudalkalibacillus salsuginis]MCF6411020.1 cytochrome c [Pseudalkalibacillus salsuginis]